MKKVILSLVFLIATGTSLMNASVNNSKISESFIFRDCTTTAWEQGTEAGNGNPESEYKHTNNYFEYYCNEDGSYKLGMAPSEG